MESWRLGDLESLRAGELETWSPGKLESWRAGDLESWRAGDFEQGFLSQDSSARNLQKNLFGVSAGIISVFSPQQTGSLSTEDQTQTFCISEERWNPYTASRTRFSNGLAHNRSKASVNKSQSRFVHINFSRSIFPYRSKNYENG